MACIMAEDTPSTLALQCYSLCTGKSTFERVMCHPCSWGQKGVSPQPSACQEINYACLQGHKKSYAFPAVHSFLEKLGSLEVVLRIPYSHYHPLVCSKSCPLWWAGYTCYELHWKLLSQTSGISTLSGNFANNSVLNTLNLSFYC